MKSEYQKKVDEIEQEIKELEIELLKWETYNNKKNDITRDEIKSLKEFQNKIKRLEREVRK